MTDPTLIHLSRNGQQFGPYTLVQVNHCLEDGTVLPTDDAWAEGCAGWVPVVQFPGVVALGNQSSPPPPPGALAPIMPQPPGSAVPLGMPPPQQQYPAAPMHMMPQMPAAALPPSRRTGLIVGIIAGVVILGILLMVGLAALGRASQGDEGTEFAKLHRAYKTKIMPMEVETLKLLVRLDDTDDDDEILALMSDIDFNLTVRIVALKTIDLNHHEIEELNEDYIKYCEKGQQMWSDVSRQYEIGNYSKGDEIIQKNVKQLTDELGDWIKRFNRLCAKHGQPDLEAIMEEIAAGM
jgi:hypothetical protein